MVDFKMLFMAVVCNLAASSFTHAQTETIKKTEAFCIDQIERRTAAIIAKDYLELAAAAKFYAQKCGSIFGAEDHSNAYEDIITAKLALDQSMQALQAADNCLNIFYGNAGCHFGRARALVNLSRFPESNISLERAERLIEGNLKKLERQLSHPQHYLEKERTEANIRKLKAIQITTNNFRKTYFPNS